MDRNPGDINPLTDFGETDFTNELIDFLEANQNRKSSSNDAQSRHDTKVTNNQNLNSKKMEIIPNPVQVIPPSAEQKELYEAPFQQNADVAVALEKPKLTHEQLTSIPDVIDGHQLSPKDKYDLLLDALVVDQKDVYYFVDDKGYIMRHFTEEPTDKEKRFVNFEDVTFDMKKTQLNEQNFEYLKKSLKYLGFGENLNSALEVRLKEGSDKFTLGASAAFNTPNAKDMVNYELRFSKSKTTDNYFLNDYQATLEKGNANGTVQEPVSRVFTLNKGNDITAKEAYNLLSGRSIQKNAEITDKQNLTESGEPTKRKEEVWMKLDFDKKTDQGQFTFKTFYKNYGFDLDKAVTAHPIKELNDPDHRERLMSSLKRGNLQSVTIEKNGTEEKAFVAASPQFKNLSLYDKDLKLVYEKPQESKVQNQEEKGYQRSR